MNQNEIKFLMAGIGNFFDDAPFGGDFKAARAAWRQNRSRLLAEWIARQPGTRPAGWWWFEARKPRRLQPDVEPQKHHLEPSNWETERSCFRFGIELPHFENELHETEREYLTRLGLLTDDDQ